MALEYPRVAYHPTEGAKKVLSPAHFDSLGPGWSLDPFPEPEPPPESPPDSLALLRADLTDLRARVEALEGKSAGAADKPPRQKKG